AIEPALGGGIGEKVERGRGAFEAFFSLLVARAHVGMQFLRELAVGATNFVRGCGPADAERGIWVPTQGLRALRLSAYRESGSVASPSQTLESHPEASPSTIMLWLTPCSTLGQRHHPIGRLGGATNSAISRNQRSGWPRYRRSSTWRGSDCVLRSP